MLKGLWNVLVTFFCSACFLTPAIATVTRSGDVTPDDPYTQWLSSTYVQVGRVSYGRFSITNGSKVSSSGVDIGYESIASGKVIIDGNGSEWGSYGSVLVGKYGQGTLEISNGGQLNNSRSYIGYYLDSTGQATIDGVGSIWTSRQEFNVGVEGNGTAEITNGGQIIGHAMSQIGMSPGSTGFMTVGGSGSAWNITNDMIVANGGIGTLNIINGGVVKADYIGHVASGPISNGTVNVSGVDSLWHIGTVLYVGERGTGNLNISNGGLVKVGETLKIDTWKTGASYVSMSTGGMLAIGGNTANSLSSFLASIDGTAAIRYWNDSISDWANITEAIPGIDYTLEYLSGVTVLTVGAVPIPGDANGDGVVDGSDVTILAGNWQYGVNDGQTATLAMGDFNADGRVDGSDVTILAGNWQYGVNATAAAVPEPNTVALLAILLATSLVFAINRRSERIPQA